MASPISILSFDDVAAVTLDTLSSSESTPGARVVLVLHNGRLPLTDHYSGSPSLWKPTLERIRGILSLGPGDSIEESERGLVTQGRKLGAIRLLRTERSLTPEVAKDVVDKL